MNSPREILSQTKQAGNEYSRIAEFNGESQSILREQHT